MKNNRGYTLVELMVVLFVICIIPAVIFLLSLWTDRNLDFWLSYLKHAPVDVPMWLSVIVSIVGNGFIVALNIIAEVARYAI